MPRNDGKKRWVNHKAVNSPCTPKKMATDLLFALASASFLQPTVPIRAFTTRSVQRASVPLALNTGSYRIFSPCTDESVLEALVDGSSTTGHWVVIMPGPLSLGPPPDSQVVPEFIASYDKPVRDGEVPLAAGRLRVGARMVERFSCSLPKEDPRHLELLGLVLDSLLLAWLQAPSKTLPRQFRSEAAPRQLLAWLQALPTAAAGFEELGAAANLHSAAVTFPRSFREKAGVGWPGRGCPTPQRAPRLRLSSA